MRGIRNKGGSKNNNSSRQYDGNKKATRCKRIVNFKCTWKPKVYPESEKLD